ncbi:NAD-dependent epimerase/dehydratase family protein [bacterium]|nr:NAD-dependent epimerase/dehydratase family protein [bacterium]
MTIVYRERMGQTSKSMMNDEAFFISICITGASGFIGTHLVRGCVAAGHRVVAFDRSPCPNPLEWHGQAVEWVLGDVTDPVAVGRAFNGCEAVFHHAAEVSVHDSIHRPLDTFHTNVQGTAVVLEMARTHGVSLLTFPSSAAVYGNSDHPVQSETDPIAPLSPYGVSKWMGECLCQAYQQQYQLNCLVLRYFNVVGKGQSPNSPYAAVIPRWIEQIEKGMPLSIYGDGMQTRDFVSVDVIVALHLHALGRQAPHHPLNVGSGNAMTVATLADVLQSVMEREVGVTHYPPRNQEVRHSCANTQSIHRMFPGLKIEALAHTLRQWVSPHQDTNTCHMPFNT